MPNDRLSQIERSLKRLREQLVNKEDTLVTIAPAKPYAGAGAVNKLRIQFNPGLPIMVSG
jgi:hypothetical protein